MITMLPRTREHAVAPEVVQQVEMPWQAIGKSQELAVVQKESIKNKEWVKTIPEVILILAAEVEAGMAVPLPGTITAAEEEDLDTLIRMS